MKRSAFTLVETMIVVAIIGLVAAIVIPAVAKVRDKNLLNKLGLKRMGNPYDGLIYNAQTKEVVKLNDERTEIIEVIGKINMPIDDFKKLSHDAQLEAIYKGWGKEDLPWELTEKEKLAKKFGETPSKSEPSVDASPLYTLDVDGSKVIIHHTKCSSPDVIAFNEDFYVPVSAAEDAPKIQDDPKYKYIENSFKMLREKK